MCNLTSSVNTLNTNHSSVLPQITIQLLSTYKSATFETFSTTHHVIQHTITTNINFLCVNKSNTKRVINHIQYLTESKQKSMKQQHTLQLVQVTISLCLQSLQYRFGQLITLQ